MSKTTKAETKEVVKEVNNLAQEPYQVWLDVSLDGFKTENELNEEVVSKVTNLFSIKWRLITIVTTATTAIKTAKIIIEQVVEVLKLTKRKTVLKDSKAIVLIETIINSKVIG